jgi:hypothetical protein
MRGKDRAAARYEQQQRDRQILLAQARLSRRYAQDLREQAAVSRWCAQYVGDRQRELSQDALHLMETALQGKSTGVDEPLLTKSREVRRLFSLASTCR